MPLWLPSSFITKVEKRYQKDCHEHDKDYGTKHKRTITRKQADKNFLHAIKAENYIRFCFEDDSFIEFVFWQMFCYVAYFYLRLFRQSRWDELKNG